MLRTRASVGQVCRRLDGVPLAIELAAARVTSMSPAELASALDRRFDVLAGGRRRAVKRQQTLRATIDWSYDLLDESQQRLLARLAVFAGGCTRDAAEAVGAGGPIEGRAVLGLLTDLVDRSLVVAERGGLETRYRLLETIREYGEERLVEHDETDALRDRHARYYADYARRCSEGLWGPEQLEWGARMTADGENILAAFAHAVDTHDLDLAVRLLESTNLIPVQTGYALTLPVEPVLAVTGVEQHPGYPVVLMAAAFAAEPRGEASLALEYGDAALDAEHALTAPRPYTIDLSAHRYVVSGLVALSTGAWDEAAAAFLEAVEPNRRADQLAFVATCLGAAASALCYGGRFADAVPVATEGLAVARAIGMPTRITIDLVALAQALSRQEPERARVLLDEAAHQDLDYEHLRRAHPDDPRRRHAQRLAPHRTLRHPRHPPPPLDEPPAVSPRHPHRFGPRPGRHRPRSRRHHPRCRPHAHRDPAPRPPRPPRRRTGSAHARRTREPRRPDRRDPPRDHPPPRRSTRRRTTPRRYTTTAPPWTPTPPSPTPSPASTSSSPTPTEPAPERAGRCPGLLK